MENMMLEIQNEVNKKFTKEDLSYYKEKLNELNKEIGDIGYCFYLMCKETKVKKDDLALLFLALH